MMSLTVTLTTSVNESFNHPVGSSEIFRLLSELHIYHLFRRSRGNHTISLSRLRPLQAGLDRKFCLNFYNKKISQRTIVDQSEFCEHLTGWTKAFKDKLFRLKTIDLESLNRRINIGSNGGALGTCPFSLCPISFIFMQISSKYLPNNQLAHPDLGKY